MTELKPCPFCGGEAKTMEQHRWWVFCPECMCDLGFEGMDESGCYGHFDTEAEAVEAWNTRHVETCHNTDEDPMYFCCSKCGSTCSVEYGDGGYGRPSFCPSCGKIVKQ